MSKRKVLITGASSGIGKAVAVFLAQKGFYVVGTTRNLTTLPEDPGASKMFRFVIMDVTDKASVRSGVEEAAGLMGGIDVLVNNAGISNVGPFEDIPEEEGRSVIETNFFGLASVTREVLPIMRNSGGGLIVNISSLGGIMGIPFQSYYAASKFAVEGFSESIRMELLSQGIDVVLVEPGNIKTGIGKNRMVLSGVSPSYQKGYDAAKQVIEKGVDGAEPPEVVARLIYKIIRKKSPKVRYPSGNGSGMICFLLKVLPQRVKEKLLLRYYRQNAIRNN
ncbi:MAG: SDR family oxidoreductase [Desulfobacterales bacterium]